ncbi:hypothetical protein [Hydrogenophaga sp.]|uniref:hypothetical protein n=1 Tax=Hydrogenophaga sp. TaxID=1904254 RepID=UPI003F72D004
MTSPDATVLREAWEAMRSRHCLHHWPQDFDAVMADPVRSRLVRMEACARARPRVQPKPHPAPCPRPETRPRPVLAGQAALFDRKRAAAGERLDD